MAQPPYDASCLFCRIIAGELPAQKLYEDDTAIVIADINPQAPLHALAIPKRHIPSIAAVTAEDGATLAAVFAAATAIARERGMDATGYRLVINHGTHAGQSVPHLHVHILGGKAMGWPPYAA